MPLRRPHSLNIFSSETTGPLKVKFHIELLRDGGTKVCSNGPGHMIKMAAMPIYGKNLKKLLLRNQKSITLNLGMHRRVLKYYQVCSNDLDLFYGKVKFGSLCFCVGKR